MQQPEQQVQKVQTEAEQKENKKAVLKSALIVHFITVLVYGLLAFFIFKVSANDRQNQTCNSANLIIVWGVIIALHFLSSLYLLYKAFQSYRSQ